MTRNQLADSDMNLLVEAARKTRLGTLERDEILIVLESIVEELHAAGIPVSEVNLLEILHDSDEGN